jgi:hypothetical protein
MKYDRYLDQSYAKKEELSIDYLFEVLFGYSYMELRLTERPSADRTDKTLVAAGKAFKFFNDLVRLEVDITEDNCCNLHALFSWIDADAIPLKLQDRVPEYQWPDRAARFMEAVLNAHKYPGGAAALKFVRRHDYWEIGFEKVKHFKHKKGLIYLQFLLTHPSKSYSCLELSQLVSVYDEVCTKSFEKNPEHYAPPPERLEDMAIIMKRNMGEMQRELQAAEEGFSPDVDLLRGQLGEELKLYNSLYDLKGRPRNAGSNDERARSAVSKTLRGAKVELLKALPELESILNRISLGLRPEYSPGQHPVEVFVGSA